MKKAVYYAAMLSIMAAVVTYIGGPKNPNYNLAQVGGIRPALTDATAGKGAWAGTGAHFDSPVSGAGVSGSVHVSGWHIGKSIPMYLFVDGIAYALPQESDVSACCQQGGLDANGGTSWFYDLHTNALLPGPHTLDIRANIQQADEIISAPLNFHVTGTTPPLISGLKGARYTITEPVDGSTVSGAFTIRGWIAGQSIPMYLFVDDTGYGLPTGAYQGHEACCQQGGMTNGYTNWFYDIDTSNWIAGKHTIDVRTDIQLASELRSPVLTINVSAGTGTVSDKPSTPSGLNISGVGDNYVTVTWNASTMPSGSTRTVVGYEVYRNGIVVNTDDTQTFIRDINLTPNTSYTYTVRAHTDSSQTLSPIYSDMSAAITAKTTGSQSAITPTMAVDKSAYTMGDVFNIQISNAAANSAVKFKWWKNGTSYTPTGATGCVNGWCDPAGAAKTTDASGKAVLTGTFNLSENVGNWKEQAMIGTQVTNEINFTVAQKVPVLTADKSSYVVGSAFTLNIINAPANVAVKFKWWKDGAIYSPTGATGCTSYGWCDPAGVGTKTDANGVWYISENFNTDSVGTWKEQAVVGNIVTNEINFSVVAANTGGTAGAPATNPIACSNADNIPATYANPCPELSLSSAIALTTQAQFEISVYPAAAGTAYVYKKIYISEKNNACPNGSAKVNNLWCAYTLPGSAEPNAPKLLAKNTGTILTFNSSNLAAFSEGAHYVVSWDWQYDAQRKCYLGPESTLCNSGKWRIQKFTISVPTQ